MATYKELVAQSEKLAKQLEEAREKEVAIAVQKIQELVNEYSIDPAALFPDAFKHAHDEGYESGMIAGQDSMRKGGGLTKSMQNGQEGRAGVRGPVAAKYRNEKTGETWSGRGIKPRWLSMALENGRNIDEFAI